MSRVLAFDCAGGSCSAAVLDGNDILARRFAAMARGHAEALMPMIQSVLAEAALDLAALDLIAVTTGPGGFTGVRIGLATAQGLRLASELPALGVTSFDAVAQSVAADDGRTLVVALDTKRDDLFLQVCAPVRSEPAQVPPADFANWVPAGKLRLAGDGAPRLVVALSGRDVALASGPGLADAADVARAAAKSWHRGMTLAPLRPLYLRAPDTTAPAPRAGVR